MTFRDGKHVRRIDLTQCDAKGRFDTTMIDRVLPHELCHLVLADYFGDAACPLLLEEGLATLAESTLDQRRVVQAGAVLAKPNHTSLEKLLRWQREDIRYPEQFYALAFSFVEFLRDLLTREQFADLLYHVKSGCHLTEALQRALYAPPDELFLPSLTAAWEDHAVADAQFIEALNEE